MSTKISGKDLNIKVSIDGGKYAWSQKGVHTILGRPDFDKGNTAQVIVSGSVVNISGSVRGGSTESPDNP